NVYSNVCKKCASKRARERQNRHFASGLCRCGKVRVEGRTRCVRCLASAQRSRTKNIAQHRDSGIRYGEELRRIVFARYGEACACCGEKRSEFFTIDHVGGWGKDHKGNNGKRLGGKLLYRWIIQHNFPEEFQTLCYNCNCSIGHHGYCPHQHEREQTLQMVA